MINIHDYFSIDWKATGDNLRDLMSDTVSEETLAKSMYVTKRTIYNWCSGKSHPSIDQLVLLAIFFNVDNKLRPRKDFSSFSVIVDTEPVKLS